MEDAFDGQIDVDDLGDRELHQGQENSFDGFAHPGIFLRRLAHHCRRVDGIFAVRDARDVEYRVQIFQ